MQEAFVRWLALWHPRDWDERMQEETGEAIAREIFKGMAEDFSPLLGTEDAEMGSDEPNPRGESAGNVFSVPTNIGTLIVTVNDPDASVQVFRDEGKIEITRPSARGPITISVDPARHSLKVEHDRTRIWAMKFESRGPRGISAELLPLTTEAEKVVDPGAADSPIE
jgi:hypothetical protein